MQLAQEVTQAVLNTYIGGEIILRNERSSPDTILKATLESARVVDSSASVSLACNGWAYGTLEDDIDSLEWRPLDSSSRIVLGTNLAIDTDGVAHVARSTGGIIVRIALPVSIPQLQTA